MAALPVGAGVLAVGGMMVVFSRSSHAAAGVRKEEGRELVRERPLGGEEVGEEEKGMEMILWKRAEGRRWVDVQRVDVLEGAELEGEFFLDKELASLSVWGFLLRRARGRCDV